MTLSAEGRDENQKLNQTAAPLSSAVVWLSFWFSAPLLLEKHLITITVLTFNRSLSENCNKNLVITWQAYCTQVVNNVVSDYQASLLYASVKPPTCDNHTNF